MTVYLPTTAARGCRYCFDPSSTVLRQALTRPSPRHDTALARTTLLEDLPFLHRLLQQQYAGYPDLLQHPTFDPNAFFAQWAERLRRAGPTISFREGIVEPLVTLRQAVPDRHLVFRGADPLLDADPRVTFHEYQAPAPPDLGTTPPVQLSAHADETTTLRWSTWRIAPLVCTDGRIIPIATISASGAHPVLTWRSGEHTLHFTRRPVSPVSLVRPPEVPAYQLAVVDDTSVITLRSFAMATARAAQLRQFVADYTLHAQQPKILFDLRHNNGGTLQYLQQWLRQAVCGLWHSYPRLEIVGALWPCSHWNLLVEQQIREGRVDTEEARVERERLREGWPATRPAFVSSLDPGVRDSHGTHPYAGRVYVLLNRHSGSSGELAAVELQRALGAILIGERSAGAMQYGEARRFVLPHTGLVCQVPTKRFFFDEEVEAVGVPVDGYLEDMDQGAATLVSHLDALCTALMEHRR